MTNSSTITLPVVNRQYIHTPSIEASVLHDMSDALYTGETIGFNPFQGNIGGVLHRNPNYKDIAYFKEHGCYPNEQEPNKLFVIA